MSKGVPKQESNTTPAGLPDLPPADFFDPVIEAYKKDVDRTLLRENLKLSVEERFRKFESFMEFFYELREAGQKMKSGQTMKENDSGA